MIEGFSFFTSKEGREIPQAVGFLGSFGERATEPKIQRSHNRLSSPQAMKEGTRSDVNTTVTRSTLKG